MVDNELEPSRGNT